MIGPTLAERPGIPAAGAIQPDAAAIALARIPIVSVCCLPRGVFANPEDRRPELIGA